MVVTIGWYQRVKIPSVSSAPPPSAALSAPSFRSAPEQNALPAPVSMTARTASSPARSPRAASRSLDSALDQAFIRSGRFSTILAAAPDRYNSIVS
jgi:hypothetical protein